MTKFEFQGTGRTVGGGDGFAGLIQVALIAAAAVALAVIIIQLMWLIFAAGVIAVAVRLFLLYQKNAHLRAYTVAFAREHEIRAQQAEGRLTAQRAHELEVASRSATVIQVHNHIDPAAILAAIDPAAIAAVLDLKRQSWPQQPVQHVRAEIQR